MTTPNTPANGGQILTWQQRCDWVSDEPAVKLAVDAMKAEIADLRAALAAPAIPTVDRNSVLEEAAAICDRLSKLYNVPDVGYDNGYTMGSKRAAEEIRAIKDVADCPACSGSGESVQMSDSGPDAYEIPCPCAHCGGAGDLESAYRGVVARLDAECKASMELSAKLFFAQPAAQGAVELDAARYKWLKMTASPGAQTNLLSTPWTRWDTVIDFARATPAEQSTDKTAEGL